MKLKLSRKQGQWKASVHRGNGGISSMVSGRMSKSLFWVLGVFSIKNLIKALKP
jgi:hypothetical protein